MADELDKTINAFKAAYNDSGLEANVKLLGSVASTLSLSFIDFLTLAQDYLEEVAGDKDTVKWFTENVSEESLEDLLSDTYKNAQKYFGDVASFLSRDEKLDTYYKKTEDD